MDWILVLCILSAQGGCTSLDRIPVTKEQCEQLLAEYKTDRRVVVYCRPKEQ